MVSGCSDMGPIYPEWSRSTWLPRDHSGSSRAQCQSNVPPGKNLVHFHKFAITPHDDFSRTIGCVREKWTDPRSAPAAGHDRRPNIRGMVGLSYRFKKMRLQPLARRVLRGALYERCTMGGGSGSAAPKGPETSAAGCDIWLRSETSLGVDAGLRIRSPPGGFAATESVGAQCSAQALYPRRESVFRRAAIVGASCAVLASALVAAPGMAQPPARPQVGHAIQHDTSATLREMALAQKGLGPATLQAPKEIVLRTPAKNHGAGQQPVGRLRWSLRAGKRL